MSRQSVVHQAEVLDTPRKPIDAIDALQHNLRVRMLARVTPERMDNMIDVQMDKADKGDTKAFLAIKSVTAMRNEYGNSGQQNLLVINEKEPRPDNDSVRLSDTRFNLVLYLRKVGPQSTVDIARDLHTNTGDIYEAADHPWFRLDKGKWFVTKQALLDILPSHEE